MSTPSTSAPSLADGNAVVPSPQPRSRTLRPLLMLSLPMSASPLSRMVAAMRVKSPFSHSAWFGFISRSLSFWLACSTVHELGRYFETRATAVALDRGHECIAHRLPDLLGEHRE